jgi:hypothetical protein
MMRWMGREEEEEEEEQEICEGSDRKTEENVADGCGQGISAPGDLKQDWLAGNIEAGRLKGAAS